MLVDVAKELTAAERSGPEDGGAKAHNERAAMARPKSEGWGTQAT